MRFALSENAHDVLTTLKLYVEHYGIPRALYTDKANIYHPKSKSDHLTDVGHALARLGVTMIWSSFSTSQRTCRAKQPYASRPLGQGASPNTDQHH